MALVAEGKVRNVALLLWNGAELLDFAGPGEVLSVAHGPEGESFRVYTVASTGEPVVSQGFVRVVPSYSIEDCPPPDVIVLPGGGVRGAIADAALMRWLEEQAPRTEVILSVCTGAFVLARAGLLDGREATTYYRAIEGLREAAPETLVREHVRYVDSGKVITSAGVSAGIDSSLHLVARLLGVEAARDVAQYMQYDWPRPGSGHEEPAAVRSPDVVEY
jgi:transcriptional regulator GlxA family with amidase domain